MALGHVEHGEPTGRTRRALLLVSSGVPLVAYALGDLAFVEAFLLYLLEPLVVGVATAVTLLVVEPPAGERASRLLGTDLAWLPASITGPDPRPLAVTTWNLRAAGRHAGRFTVAFWLGYGPVALLVLSLADAASSTAGLDAVTTASLAVLLASLLLGQVRDLVAVVAAPEGRRYGPETVVERARLDAHRLYLLGFCYVLGGVGAVTVLEAAPGAALIGFAAIKTAVDLLYQARVDEIG